MALVLAGCASSADPDPTTRASVTRQNWRMILNEEFAGTTLDASRWSTCYWWADETCTNEANNELQLYTPGNVAVSDGTLRLTARQEAASWNGQPFAYTSGMISGSRERETMVPFLYGYVEARARVPAGSGLWSALWLLPADHETRPEIDIFEIVGETPDIDHHALHSPAEEKPLRHRVATSDLSAGWHVFGVDWAPDHVTWYVDGRKTWTVTRPHMIPRVPMYVVANLAVGGDFPTQVLPSTPFPSALEIDYIRVWQKRGGGPGSPDGPDPGAAGAPGP